MHIWSTTHVTWKLPIKYWKGFQVKAVLMHEAPLTLKTEKYYIMYMAFKNSKYIAVLEGM